MQLNFEFYLSWFKNYALYCHFLRLDWVWLLYSDTWWCRALISRVLYTQGETTYTIES